MLQTYPALQFYFLSTEEPTKILQNFFSVDFGELHFLLIYSLMYIFHDKLECLEREDNSLFIPFLVKKRLNELREEDKDAESDKFVDSILSVYQNLMNI